MSAPPLPLPAGLFPGAPLTALAPMQDVTDLAFMRVTAHYGAPDYYFTEFLRVHAQELREVVIRGAVMRGHAHKRQVRDVLHRRQRGQRGAREQAGW